MTRSTLPGRVADDRVVAIMRGLSTARAVEVAHAILEGGISVLEITMDSPNAAVTIETLASLGLAVGAGTILSIDDGATAVDAGAQFLVAPHTDAEVVTWAVEHGHAIVPGALTPTEIMTAWSLGASAVKLFPASVGGPELVRTIRGPLSNIPLITTGGVDGTNIASFLSAGAFAVGVGGWLVDSDDLGTVRDRAAHLISAARAVNV